MPSTLLREQQQVSYDNLFVLFSRDDWLTQRMWKNVLLCIDYWRSQMIFHWKLQKVNKKVVSLMLGGYCFSPGFVVRVCYYYSVKIIWTAASSSQKLGENGLNQFFGKHQQFSSSMCKLESEEHHFLAWRLLSNCCRGKEIGIKITFIS